MLTIMGKATRDPDKLNAFLRSKGCPEYAQLYKRAGEAFGVRWDIAIFQSCLETGWFTFPGDVKKSQNNFAGLGATGNGVPGDSFPDAWTGILAQVQDLALRCDTYLPKESIVSPYAKKNYETISNRHSKYWEDLAGTWAMDPHYHEKIYAIMKEFDSKYQNSEDTTMSVPTWYNISGQNGTVIQAMKDNVCVDQVITKDVSEARAFLSKYSETAKTFAVGNAFPFESGNNSKKKTTIFLDPGHSNSRPGARSNDGTVKEEMLNQIACNVIKKILEKNGYSVTMWDPDPDNLVAVGTKSRGFDVAISWHHNSYSGSSNPYHCIMVDPQLPSEQKKIASRLAIAMEKGARGTCADTNVFEGTSGLLGVYEAELTVLNTSANDPDGKKPFHILPEGYFLNKMNNTQACIAATEAIAESFTKQLMLEFPD